MLIRLRIVAVICILATVSYGQPTLPADEVDSLRIIAGILGKTDWDFSVDPCSGLANWAPNTTRNFEQSVTCDCTFASNTTCHVDSIILRGQNLQGTVPTELVRLPFLRAIDLTRNYLNGTIPPEWGSMSLVNISLIGNRVTGPLPRQLANISTLAILNLEYNQLSGSIPPEFGNFRSIERMTLSSNNLTGQIPASLGNLATLRDFRISDNNFTGSIPNFIGNWANLSRIMIQGSGLSGPIPSSFASLTRLTEVRISDLSGNSSTIPSLILSTSLRTLILRSCNIVGQIPDFIGQMRLLNHLDLSFNSLSGPIPTNFEALNGADQIYLTGNSLDGPLPTWMLQEGEVIDLSYNNLSPANTQANCQPRKLNLFASSRGNRTGIIPCIRNSACQQTIYSLHVNCGGRDIGSGNSNYEDDASSGGPSTVFHPNNNALWAFSSTGNFLDNNLTTDLYIVPNTSSIIGQDPQLYMDARISPLSLTYYGICLQNGNYTVNLHFAEIMFTGDRTYSSLGRRIFDIYIQRNLVVRDFNIEAEAGGVNRALVRNFTAVVTDRSLEIRLYWAGKGTNGIPVRGVYGPLISAISVNPNFPVPSNGNGISTGAIVGIVVGILAGIGLCLGILWWIGCFKRKDTLEYELKDVDLQATSFSLRKIKVATNNFDPANKIGEGGFGPVYKGLLSDGTAIAVKMLSAKSKQGNREFVTEIGMISALQHPYLVKLHGCCIEGNNLLLIYEYLENNSLARAIFGPKEHQIHLDWPTRHKICIGIAKGLAYLHEESRLKIVHRDIKATNVLLDKNLNPKISDFGLAKLDDENATHMSTRVAGTYGYMAPEYAMRGHLTDKADVYSFGIVLLEVVSGRPNTSFKSKEESFYLLDWAKELNETGDLMELVDPRFESNFNKEEVMTSIQVALHCTNVVSTDRPSMSTVVSILEGKSAIQGFVPTSSVSSGKPSHREMTSSDKAMFSNNSEGHTAVSIDVPWMGSSTDTTMLNPVPLNSDYWEKRDGK